MDQLQRLLEIMARLRDPEGGCPWDVQQDFASLVPYTLEEAYEVADAVARGDLDELRDELGDLLLQVVFHAQIAREQGAFEFTDVARAISDKMVRRHPHVFDDTVYADAAEQRAHWERLKAEERAAKGSVESEPGSAIDGVALALPALNRAEKLQKRASRVGFDWDDIRDVEAKVYEELDEVREASEEGCTDKLTEEVGDLLFTAVNLARHHRVDPEVALRVANDKFSRRFRAVESRLSALDIAMPEAGAERIEALWDAVKRDEHSD